MSDPFYYVWVHREFSDFNWRYKYKKAGFVARAILDLGTVRRLYVDDIPGLRDYIVTSRNYWWVDRHTSIFVSPLVARKLYQNQHLSLHESAKIVLHNSMVRKNLT